MARTFITAFTVLLALGQPGLAQVSFDPAAQEVGTVTKWFHEYGTRQITYLGQDEKGFKYEWRNKTGRQALVLMIWRNSDGQGTRLEGGDETQTYQPHDCRLIIGRCEYIYSYLHKTLPDRQERRIVINSVKDGVWSYKRYRHDETPENLDSEGTFTVDEFGIVIDRGTLRRAPARGN